mmetsp:Transcript_1191/g.2023  ORF Transcript_1191/g.2023 Transcript_1191/m.2023 type:complete len:220 (-) Transcript_1191:1300-1959(-)
MERDDEAGEITPCFARISSISALSADIELLRLLKCAPSSRPPSPTCVSSLCGVDNTNGERGAFDKFGCEVSLTTSCKVAAKVGLPFGSSISWDVVTMGSALPSCTLCFSLHNPNDGLRPEVSGRLVIKPDSSGPRVTRAACAASGTSAAECVVCLGACLVLLSVTLFRSRLTDAAAGSWTIPTRPCSTPFERRCRTLAISVSKDVNRVTTASLTGLCCD